MPSFICFKCGCIDNSAGDNNYWIAEANNQCIKKKEDLFIEYDDPWYNTHPCCADCCTNVGYKDGEGVISQGWHNWFEKKHWSTVGSKDDVLKICKEDKGNLVNAEKYFNYIETKDKEK